jgi:hypothetical protein
MAETKARFLWEMKKKTTNVDHPLKGEAITQRKIAAIWIEVRIKCFVCITGKGELNIFLC